MTGLFLCRVPVWLDATSAFAGFSDQQFLSCISPNGLFRVVWAIATIESFFHDFVVKMLFDQRGNHDIY